MSEHAGRSKLHRVKYFFPFQLVFIHLKRNHFLLIFWLILFAVTLGKFASKFGIPDLFLAPEYQGEVGIWSFGILGFSLGGFIMAFNIYSYILHAKRFPFLATTSRPFLKYCINNFLIPLSYILTYIICSATFLLETELLDITEVIEYMLAFLAGNFLFLLLAFLYFFPTNKNIFKITGRSAEHFDEIVLKKSSGIHRKRKTYYKKNKVKKWRVVTYLAHPFKIQLARDSRHYDAETLQRVFYQNHVNASLFELIVILVFVIIGAFQFNPFFEIPAAASACLVFTVILMVISVIMSWLKGWTLSLLLAALLILNAISGNWVVLNMPNYGYGMNYDLPPVKYDIDTIEALNSDPVEAEQDLQIHRQILNTWLADKRRAANDPWLKPKLIIVNATGGGLRSSLWTLRTLQWCDSVSKGQLFQDTKFISGSSGGMIGAAYYREIQLLKNSVESNDNPDHLDNISKDILNRIMFSFATNDIFIRFRTHSIHGKSYVLDRAMTFEHQLNLNTNFIFDKPISANKDLVKNGKMPMMVFSPTIVNDGRRLLISSQPISFLGHYSSTNNGITTLTENVEFSKFFAKHDADSLLLSSAIRMSSTFPYILPYASLPTDPVTHVLDAGLRDNFGFKLSAQYMLALKGWIEENTSGVVVVQIRDSQKNAPPKTVNSTILNKISNPIGSFYGNYFHDQDFNMDQMLTLIQSSLEVPVDLIPFELRFDKSDNIALSWRLTSLEKKKVIESIEAPWNKESIDRLLELLDE